MLFMGLMSMLGAQVDNCFYNRTVSGTPSVDVSFLAENKLTSSHIIDTPLPIHYGAQYEICFDTGFSILQGRVLTADLNGCVAECIPPSNICEEPCTTPLVDSVTDNGQRYVKHEVVITFPDKVTDIVMDTFYFGNTSLVFLYVNGKTFDIADTLNTHISKVDSNLYTRGTLERCLCDRNVFLYTNENLIFEEGGIAQRNKSSGGIKEEGGVYSLNYILEHLEPQIPDSVVMQNVSFKDRGQYTRDPKRKLVAILDSGLDPEHVPMNSLFYDPQNVHSVCPLSDVSGWNFVDNNDDLTDDRGHGTLVALSYFYALGNMFPLKEVQDQSLLTVKVLNECGEGTTYSTICGLRYAELKGAQVINASWGMYQNDRQLQRAIEELDKLGIMIVASAGNQALDLTKKVHFPSGYSSPFDYIVDDSTVIQHSGMDYVIEVGGMCKYITSPCEQIRENTPLTSSSNFRDILFVEASKGIEQLLPKINRPDCEIEGTSYAAPQITAGVVHRLLNEEDVTKDKMWLDSKKIHPNNNYKSYRTTKCEE